MALRFVHYDPVLRSHLVRKERSTDGRERYVAWFPDLEGCRAQAEKDDEAVALLYDLLPRYVAAMRALGGSVARTYTDLKPAIRATFRLC